jgi:D-3-phosphoglycerate dehydrogenase
MKKLVITQRLHEDGMKMLDGKVNVVITNTGKPREMLPELLDADGLIIRIGSIDRETMLAAKHLQVIGRPGVGVDNVDMATATELGIPVVIAPGANTRSVAEHVMALMFAAAKDLLYSDARTRAGDFNVRNSFKAFELRGKTLGLVGCGNIGRELALLALAIGMQVVVYDPYIEPSAVERLGCRHEKDLTQLLRTADVVSLHVPLTPQTRNCIGERELNLMQPTAILINCARGEVVDENALAVALKNHVIQCGAFDVLTSEPVDPKHPLLQLENFIITPHMAGQTKEAASGVATMAAQGCLAVLAGEKWPHVANKAAYDHPRWKDAAG